MTLNDLRDRAYAYAEKQGFHENVNFGEKFMLIVSELSEALEADRKEKRTPAFVSVLKLPHTLGEGVEKAEDGYPQFMEIKSLPENWITGIYDNEIKGTVEEEIADAVIRIFDLAGIYGIDLDWHVRAKMAYNETRPYKHGKKYG